MQFQLRTRKALAAGRHTVTVGSGNHPGMFEHVPGHVACLADLPLRDSFTIANELAGDERLLHDAMLGDRVLFTRADGVERLWEIAMRLPERPREPQAYGPGS